MRCPLGVSQRKAAHSERESQGDYCRCKMDSRHPPLRHHHPPPNIILQLQTPSSLHSSPPQQLRSHHHHLHLSPGVFLPLIPPGMWLWLRRGCPVCALPEQPLQGGPQPAEVQALPGLCAHQPRAEGKLLHHQQRRVRRLSPRVGGAAARRRCRFSVFSFCLFD